MAPRGPLKGVKVVDCAPSFAGPGVASLMSDFGADVLKVEHPRGDSLRSMGWRKDGVSLWWALTSRNKRCVTLKLSTREGREILRELVRDAHFGPPTERHVLPPGLAHPSEVP